MEAKQRVLVVEDEAAYVAALTSALSREQFAVEVARTGTDALRQFHARPPDIILLDVMLPGLSGLDVCRTIRATSNVPIIMVTARAEEADAVVGLELGADDYVVKPYRVRELVARMRTALRRAQRAQEPGLLASAFDDDDEVLTEGPITLDLGRHAVTVNGTDVTLTVKEFGLLEALMSRPGRALSRSDLVDQVWEQDYGETKTVDVHIMRLRAKLNAATGGQDYIKTIRGVGYRLEVPEPSNQETGHGA